MKELEQKVAIVTGGASGIGRAIALRFARAGARVAVVDVAESAAQDTVREIATCSEGRESVAVPCDVSRQADVAAAFEKLLRRFRAKGDPGRGREMFEQLSRTQPIGRMGRPEEIAELALFLCSDAADFITGCNYAIDGGFVTLKM